MSIIDSFLNVSRQAANRVLNQTGATNAVQDVADIKSALNDIQNGKTDLNQKGLDGYSAVLANASITSTVLNGAILGLKPVNHPLAIGTKSILITTSFTLNLGIATTSVPLAAALYKEGRYSDAVSTLLSGASGALGAINDVQSLNPKITPLEAKTNIAQLVLSLAAMAESEYKFTDQAIEALSDLIENVDKAIKDAWQSFKDFDGNKKWNDFLDNFADWFLPKAHGFSDWFEDLENWLADQFDWLGDKFSDWFDGLNRDGNYFLYDPLVLDLDGDGVELIAENDWNGVLFDFNGNGIKTATQWVKSDDGLLVFDRNDNGKIDNGSELFGEDTIKRPAVDTLGGASKPQEKDDGFDALRIVDFNLDGKINAKDSEWQNLRVWRDLNACNDEFFIKHFVYNFQVA